MNRTIKLSLLAILLATAFTGCKDPENNENNVEIKVTTYMPTEITTTTAQCGGHVTITGSTTARIAELGVCWGTEEDPIATDSHLSTTVTNEPFNCTLEGLMSETQYHVRAYALYESEYYYGEDLGFTTLADNGGGGGEEPNLPEGITQGLFSVSETLRVHFSQGNLQYQASTRTWRFAESQLDYIGEGNANIGETYDGWIDLFGWGTSGYNHGANAYQPWSTSEHYSDYYAYGNGRNNLFDQTGQADWGYNAISNGGNTENNGWRTLHREEWNYLMSERVTPTGIHFATACIDGTNGMLIFPDDWDGSYNITQPDNYSADYGNNAISATDWENLETKGVVFLPAAGIRVRGVQVGYLQTGAVYWSSTASSSDLAYSMYFIAGDKHRDVDVNYREYGASVRLVMNDTEEHFRK